MKKLPIFILIVAVVVILIVIALPFSGHLFQAAKSHLKSLENHLPNLNSSTNSNQPANSAAPLISQNVPAFSSSGYDPASNANDASYDTQWRSQGSSSWLAYDLSKVPASKKNKVLVVWYNESTNYDHTLIKMSSYNMPGNYTIDVNSAAGGGNPPTTDWVTAVTVRGNTYHSRQHVISMAGDNWLRINVTATDGAVENYDTNINMDVYDASTALSDDWIFYGDSITAGAMGHLTLNQVAAFAQLISAQLPSHYPVEEDGGTSYLTSSDGALHIHTWLGLFPGKYAGLSYGTNDAIGCVSPNTFYQNYVTMVQAVLQAGKIPLVPYMPWGRNSNIQKCGPALNAQITRLYSAFPQIIHGPDLWRFFQSHQDLISSDNIHPTPDAGFGAYRQQWASTMLKEVYKV